MYLELIRHCVLATSKRLMEVTSVDKLDALLSNDVNSSYEQSTDTECADSALRQPNLESQLFVTHAGLKAELEKEINDVAVSVCIRRSQ